MHDIELLAPAGSAAALHAAVRGGADAVYLGLDSFNARRGADNFTLDSLGDACRYAHMRGVRVYVTFNTMVLPRRRRVRWKPPVRPTVPEPMRSSFRTSVSPSSSCARCPRHACTHRRR